MRQSILYLLCFWHALALLGLAQAGIPTRYLNDPAIDLVYKGKHLLSDEVDALYVSSKGRFDISNLNPIEDSDLWKDAYPKNIAVDNIFVNDLDEVDYHSNVLTPSGMYRFNVHATNQDGRIYTMMLGKTVHSVLLAKALLRKIGYSIPNVKYLPRIVVRFKNETERQGFLSYLEKVAFAGNPKNWVVDDTEENKLVLQDIVVMDSTNEIYNLAVGVSDDMIQGRRLLSSLAVPLSIVNLTESVNLLRWSAGNVVNNEVNLGINNLEDFACSWDDARWISKRIEKLSREDWEDIVSESNLPKPVQTILVEKLISRRNSIMKLFKIDAKEFKVDADVTNGTDLVKGKLTKQNWPGYGSRFAYGDPESPLSDSEIKSWIGSKAISTVMDSAVEALNLQTFMSKDFKVDLPTNLQDSLTSLAQKSVASGLPSDLAVQGWIIPTIRGQLILSRNLVTGTYLGTDNLVQMVDTIGVSVNGGLGIGVGFGTSFNLDPNSATTVLSAKASADLSVMRTFAHLRPVTSIKASLKYPFKNIIVPLVKFDYGKKLHAAAMSVFDSETSDKDKTAKIEEALKPLKDAMLVGESLLVTDTVSTSGAFQLSFGFKFLLKAALGVLPGHVVVSRFHVHRKSEDEFHIYKDLAQEGVLGVAFDISSVIPIVKLGLKNTAGSARVKFYSINLNPKNPKAIENAALLRRAIILSSTKDMDESEDNMPYVIKHKFAENSLKAGLFFWQWEKLNSRTEISVTHPKGDTRYFKRQYIGTSSGRNYQAYAFSLISNWVSLIFNKPITINDGGGNNPGFSFQGKGETKFATFDQEVTKEGAMIEPFVKITTVKNGWSINRKKANLILDEMKMKYRYEFFNAPVLNDTQRIFLYNVSVNLMFYRTGIEYLFELKEDEIKKIFRENHAQKNLVINPASVTDAESGVKKFLSHMNDFRYFENKEDEKNANKYLMKAFTTADNELNLKGLALLMGGDDRLYMQARIDGFREGDEDGDKPVISSALGEYGSRQILGPVVGMQRNLDMLEGEFFIYWIMTRLI